MHPHINVHLLAGRVAPESLAGRTVVVIDVLRATTTIAAAVAAGVEEVIPCGEVEEARGWKQRDPRVLLGGERGGLPIEGFDLGNSPLEYTPERVAGQRLIFTTTNGTQAMLRCRQAGRVLLGAFVNLEAVVQAIAGAPTIELLCAGRLGAVSREDSLLAGAIVDRFQLRSPTATISDEAALARDAWQGVSRLVENGASLAETLRNGAAGRNLSAIGLERDIDAAAQIDAVRLVPELDVARWCIGPPRRWTAARSCRVEPPRGPE